MSPLDRWLDSHGLPATSIARTRPLAGGFRNDNLLVVTDAGERFVLRRYRQDDRCAVEAALLARVATAVPVPEVLAADPDGAVAGEPVLLMRFAAGSMVWAALAAVGPREASDLGRTVGRVLAAVGSVSFPAAGFFAAADLTPVPMGDPGLAAFVADCLTRRHPDHRLSEREAAGVQRVADAAARHLVAAPPDCRLVHADFNPKNLLAHRGAGGWAVTAVLDWEFAFSGSPLFDVGNMLRFSADYPPGYVAGFLTGFQEAGGHLPENWREVSQALDTYALAEFLTRPPSEVSRRAVKLLRSAAAAL